MLISKERGTWKTIDGDRVSRGRFNTAGREWLKPQIIKFLQDREPTAFVDPFAGQGHLLDALTSEGFGPTLGFDIIHCKWPRNDSLLAIPPHPGAAIVTNPPYLARHSAKRKRVSGSLATSSISSVRASSAGAATSRASRSSQTPSNGSGRVRQVRGGVGPGSWPESRYARAVSRCSPALIAALPRPSPRASAWNSRRTCRIVERILGTPGLRNAAVWEPRTPGYRGGADAEM